MKYNGFTHLLANIFIDCPNEWTEGLRFFNGVAGTILSHPRKGMVCEGCKKCPSVQVSKKELIQLSKNSSNSLLNLR